MATMAQIPLMKLAMYEALRIDPGIRPPVQFQYGRAKKDLVVESHDSVFEVKAREIDVVRVPTVRRQGPVIFNRPEGYTVDRFVKEGEIYAGVEEMIV